MSPFYSRLPNVPGFGADTTAATVGLVAVGGMAGAIAAHATGKAVQGHVVRRRLAKPGGLAEGSAVAPAPPPHPPPAPEPSVTDIGSEAGTAPSPPAPEGGDTAEDKD